MSQDTREALAAALKTMKSLTLIVSTCGEGGVFDSVSASKSLADAIGKVEAALADAPAVPVQPAAIWEHQCPHATAATTMLHTDQKECSLCGAVQQGREALSDKYVAEGMRLWDSVAGYYSSWSNDAPDMLRPLMEKHLRAALTPTPQAPQPTEQPFGWLFEGPQGLRQFSKAEDCIKPVLDLHRRMAQEQPGYTLTPLYAHPVQEAELPLTVWYGSMPESNGKKNWAAILHRGDFMDGIAIARSEYPDRVRYEADRMRHLIGELPEAPDILAYDADLCEAGRASTSEPAQAVQATETLIEREACAKLCEELEAGDESASNEYAICAAAIRARTIASASDAAQTDSKLLEQALTAMEAADEHFCTNDIRSTRLVEAIAALRVRLGKEKHHG